MKARVAQGTQKPPAIHCHHRHSTELVKLDHPEGDDPKIFATEMWEIHEDCSLRVLGGCCGTDDRHMRALAARIASSSEPE